MLRPDFSFLRNSFYAITMALAFVCVFSIAAKADDFNDWKNQFYAFARNNGITGETLRAADPYITLVPKVIEYDQRQPEKTQTYAEYLAKTITSARIAKARQKYQQNKELLLDIEQEYQVPAEVLVAVWAMESEFGERQGNFSILSSLSTLAYEGRRKELFETELFNALRISQDRGLSPASLTGSWAGAMGQCQFMPSSYIKYAVDQDGDGKADIWRSAPDALASIANYLHQNGWNKTTGISQNVRVPDDLDPDLVKEKLAKPVSEWHSLGIVRPSGAALYLSGAPAMLVEPDGEGGQAFLAYDNFGVLLRWNRSTYFALAVADLSGRINPKLKNVRS